MAHPTFSTPYNWEKRRAAELQELQLHQNCPSVPVHYEHMDLEMIPEGSLKDASGKVVSTKQLLGKSVALYFAYANHPKCSNFLPFLLQFYRTINEGGNHQKIEVIFVSLDNDKATFEKHRAAMPWLSLDVDSPITEALKRHFRVYESHEGHRYGIVQRSLPPAVVICGSRGQETQLLQINTGREEGRRALLRWDWRNTVYQ